jgi:hypothetical protein
VMRRETPKKCTHEAVDSRSTPLMRIRPLLEVAPAQMPIAWLQVHIRALETV